MSLTYTKNAAKMAAQSRAGYAPDASEPVFTQTQKRAIFYLCVFSFFAPYYPDIDVLSIKGQLLIISVIMLGFTMTSLSFLINKVAEIAKEGRGTFSFGIMFKKGINLYGVLIRNAKMATGALLLNVVLGIVLIMLDTDKIKEDSIFLNLLESVVLVSIAIALSYTVCLILRIFTVITNINVED